jgi:hypothetical protein
VHAAGDPSNVLGQLEAFAHCGLGGTRTFHPASVHVAVDEQSPVVKSPYSHPSDASLIPYGHAVPGEGSVAGHTKQLLASAATSIGASLAASVIEASDVTSMAPHPQSKMIGASRSMPKDSSRRCILLRWGRPSRSRSVSSRRLR